MARNKLVNRVMSFIGLDEHQDEDYGYDELNTGGGGYYEGNTAPVYEPPQEEPQYFTNEKKIGKVVNHPSMMNEQQTRHRTVIYHIREFDASQGVIDDLLDGNSVFLNLEDIDAATSQRIIDMLSGAAYAIQATIKKAAQGSYVIAPYGVEVASMDDRNSRATASASGYFASRR